MSQQQVPTGPAPMEEVERMNVVMVQSQQQGMGFRNPYAMDVDRRENRN